ncbi:MAG: ATP-binding cassette domain-containing protein [Oscillospiraceae bacterium]|jgi:oligopeptide transport system ATP-binding protein|nr:ATP-binding cassette domain-containing protein [Oscillospiraceae bacterium]
MAAPLIQVENLKKYFPAGRKQLLKAVDDVSFSIGRGTTLGLVGESGCGKTTIGRTILGIYEPDGGRVLYDGADLAKLNKAQKKAMTRKMQMVFQDPYASLNPFFTVGEIIEEGLLIHKLYPDKAQRRERVYGLLELVGLNREHANRFPHEFSGGQRQRVGIARALALEPEFLVCDEAISALDVSIQAQVVNMLMQFQREMSLTYLFITHDLSMVRHIADQTAVMYMGKMVEYADTGELYSRPAHPYTIGLLSAVPAADPDYQKSHQRIHLQGEVPSPINPKPGCRFCGRCSKALPRCAEEEPVLKNLGGGHFAACHLL